MTQEKLAHEEFLREKFAREWDAATISNNFLFTNTMESYPDLCRRLIERILHMKIRRIEYPEREKVIAERIDSKGVRLDVYAADDENRMFNLEMQVSNEDNLAKRMRYYQGLLDLNNLKRGEKYGKLSDSFIIFICRFDYFKRGRSVYTFRARCDEDFSLLLGDGATKIFLNTTSLAADADETLRNFLEYVEHGAIKDDFIKELDAAVRAIRSAEKVRLEYVTLELEIQRRAEKAREEGREEGRFDMVKKMLSVKTPIEYIVAATGWGKEKILKLADAEQK